MKGISNQTLSSIANFYHKKNTAFVKHTDINRHPRFESYEYQEEPLPLDTDRLGDEILTNFIREPNKGKSKTTCITPAEHKHSGEEIVSAPTSQTKIDITKNSSDYLPARGYSDHFKLNSTRVEEETNYRTTYEQIKQKHKSTSIKSSPKLVATSSPREIKSQGGFERSIFFPDDKGPKLDKAKKFIGNEGVIDEPKFIHKHSHSNISPESFNAHELKNNYLNNSIKSQHSETKKGNALQNIDEKFKYINSFRTHRDLESPKSVVGDILDRKGSDPGLKRTDRDMFKTVSVMESRKKNHLISSTRIKGGLYPLIRSIDSLSMRPEANGAVPSVMIKNSNFLVAMNRPPEEESKNMNSEGILKASKGFLFSELSGLLAQELNSDSFFQLRRSTSPGRAFDSGKRALDTRRNNLLSEIGNIEVPNPFVDEEKNENTIPERQITKKLLEDLKKDNPNVFSHIPAGRKDVLQLRDWLNRTLRHVFRELKLEIKEKISIADEIYNISMNELIRQISYYCLEQGELLMDIWKCYFLVFRKYFELEHERRVKLKQDSTEDYIKSIKMYREQINNRQKEIKRKDENVDRMLGQIAQLRIELEEMQDKEKKMRDKLESNRVLMLGLKRKCVKLVNENAEYVFKLTKYKEVEKDRADQSNIKIFTQEASNQVQHFESPNHTQETEHSEFKEDDENEIMKLLQEADGGGDGQNDYVIIKNTLEKKEKILSNKSTDIDDTYRALNQRPMGIQTELTLVERKYNALLKRETLDECLQDLQFRKNILSFSNMDPLKKRRGVFYDQTDSNVGRGAENNMNKRSVIEILNMIKGDTKPEQDNKATFRKMVTKEKNDGGHQKNLEKRNSLSVMPDVAKLIKFGEKTELKRELSIETFSQSSDSSSDSESEAKKKDSESSLVNTPDFKLPINSSKNIDQKMGSFSIIPSDAQKNPSIANIPANKERRLSQFSTNMRRASLSSKTEILDFSKIKPPQPIINQKKPVKKPTRDLTNTGVKGIKRGSTKQVKNEDQSPASKDNIDEDQLKEKILDLLDMFQLETQKTELHKQRYSNLAGILTELLNFTRGLINYLKEHVSNALELEEFKKQFLEIRRKIPKELDPNYEEEVQKVLKGFKSNATKKLKNIRKFVVPKLGGPKTTALFDRTSHPGYLLTKKIKQTTIGKSFQNFMPLKNVLKLITQIYDEKMAMCRENPLVKEQDMCIFTFNNFLNRYGFKKVAEQKFTLFSVSILKYLHIFRVNVFARCMNLLDDKLNYSVNEVKKYMEGFEYLILISTTGISVPHLESNPKRYAPFVRALDYLRVFSENKLTQEEISEIRKEVETFKENDERNINKTGLIDIDLLLTLVLAKYRALMNRTKTYVINAFKAADLDGNKMCNLSEFVLLYRHIEKGKFVEEEVIKMFEDSADIIKDNEKNMSFDKFTSISIEFQLFTDVQQDKFLEVQTSQEIEDKFKILQVTWKPQKTKLEGYLEELKSNLDITIYENWVNILAVLEKRVSVERDASEVKPVLIAFKIMTEELERIIKEKELIYAKLTEEEEYNHSEEEKKIDKEEEEDKVMAL